jgi:hypothetical protein
VSCELKHPSLCLGCTLYFDCMRADRSPEQKDIASLHSRGNHLHATSSNGSQISNKEKPTLKTIDECAQILLSRTAYKLTGLNVQVGHFYPIWVLSMGNGVLICISPMTWLYHTNHHLNFVYCRDSIIQKIT